MKLSVECSLEEKTKSKIKEFKSKADGREYFLDFCGWLVVSIKVDCLSRNLGLFVECPPWGALYGILARIYGSIGESHGKLRTARGPTSGTAVTLETGRWEVPGSNPSRACRPSRSEFSMVFSETRLNSG